VLERPCVDPAAAPIERDPPTRADRAGHPEELPQPRERRRQGAARGVAVRVRRERGAQALLRDVAALETSAFRTSSGLCAFP
jgi:hypothetical protein